jgi:hypothetical protein
MTDVLNTVNIHVRPVTHPDILLTSTRVAVVLRSEYRIHFRCVPFGHCFGCDLFGVGFIGKHLCKPVEYPVV